MTHIVIVVVVSHIVIFVNIDGQSRHRHEPKPYDLTAHKLGYCPPPVLYLLFNLELSYYGLDIPETCKQIDIGQ